MPAIRPILAYNALKSPITFPVVASAKIDGIRCIVDSDGVALSRTGKPIPNQYIREWIRRNVPPGTDGELTSGTTFQSSTSGIMTQTGEPQFTYWVFDNYLMGGGFFQRVVRILKSPGYDWQGELKEHAVSLTQQMLTSETELTNFEELCLGQGAEGVMIRDPNGGYKHGRSTAKEGLLGKLKRFEDREAIVLDVVPLMHNVNEPELNEIGYTKRSSHQVNKIADEKLGALVVRDLDKSEWVFNVGTGFDDAKRIELWQNSPIGKIIKYRYQPHGTKDLPRTPVFLGFRHPGDI